MNSFYLGIDLHRTKPYAVFFDKAGEGLDERQILNDETIQDLEENVPKGTFAVLSDCRVRLSLSLSLLVERGNHFFSEAFD